LRLLSNIKMNVIIYTMSTSVIYIRLHTLLFFSFISSSVQKTLSDYGYDRKRSDISTVNCERDDRSICSVGKLPPGITANVSMKYWGSSAPDRIPPLYPR